MEIAAQRPVPHSTLTSRERRVLAGEASDIVTAKLLTDCLEKQRQVVSVVFRIVQQELGHQIPGGCRVVLKGGAAFELHMQHIVAELQKDLQRLENASQQQKLRKLEGMLRIPKMFFFPHEGHRHRMPVAGERLGSGVAHGVRYACAHA